MDLTMVNRMKRLFCKSVSKPGIQHYNHYLAPVLSGWGPALLATAIAVVSIGCDKQSPKVENTAHAVVGTTEPTLPLFKLPDMAQNISSVFCEHDTCRFSLHPANDEESRLLSSMDEEFSSALNSGSESEAYQTAYKKARLKLNEYKTIGGNTISDRFNLACPDGPVPGKLDTFEFYADELSSGALAVVKAHADVAKCILAIKNASLPTKFKIAPLQNLAGQPSAKAILETVRTQLLKTSNGKARATIAKLDMGNQELITYVRGRFPGGIDGVVSLAWVPVRNDPKGRKIDALLFVDAAGTILLEPIGLSVGDEGQGTHKPVALLDLDGDNVDELVVDTGYSGGGQKSIYYWMAGTSKSIVVDSFGE